MQCRLFYCIMENEQRGMITFILAVCGNVDYVYSFPQSPPSRAAWIEIEESRPLIRPTTSPPSRAAWIEIADNNNVAANSGRRLHGRRGLKSRPVMLYFLSMLSPPSRAAWIEMFTPFLHPAFLTSPPSRAAWIEIIRPCATARHARVAAFTGGVD